MTHPNLRIDGTLPDGEVRVALGIFDGFHRGHQVLAQFANTIMTLYPHPATVLGYETVAHLTTLEELRDLYPAVLALQFEPDVAKLDKDSFLTLLVDRLNPKKIVVGYDYHFGANRSGTLSDLRNFCEEKKIELEVVQPVQTEDTPYKSSKIRDMVRSGQFNKAVDWLGHDYPLFGTVVHGEGRGASLGFPTANLSLPEEKLCPQIGVYTGRVSGPGLPERPAMIYIGNKPTFNERTDHRPAEVEVFIPGFEGTLYGQPLKVYLTQWIRGEEKFPSKEALVHQITRDLEALS